MSSGLRRPLLAVALMFAAMLAFVSMQAVVRFARTAGMHTTEVMFFRTAPGLPLLFWVLRRRGQRLWPEQPRNVWTRCLLGSLAMSTNFTSMRFLTLAQFSTLGLSQPVFVGLASPLLLGERVRAHTWLAMALSFSGAWVLLDPSSEARGVPLFAAGLGLASALSSAFAHIWVRKATESDPPERVVFHFAAWVSLGSLVLGLSTGHFRALPAGLDATSLALSVLGLSGFGTLGQVLMTRAYVHGEATTVSTVGYAGVGLSMLLDLILWDIAPGPSVYVGATLMGSAALVLLRGQRAR